MDRKYKYPSDCEKNDIDGDFCGKNGGYRTFYGTVQKTWNFACTCENDGTHGIMLGKEKCVFRKMTFIHVLS